MTRRSFISGDDRGGMNRRDFIAGAASVPFVASVPVPVVADKLVLLGWYIGLDSDVVTATYGRVENGIEWIQEIRTVPAAEVSRNIKNGE